MTLIEGILLTLIVVAFATGYAHGRISSDNSNRRSRIVNDAEMIAKARRDK